jgi:predicted nicotinamide N-methyase
MICKEEKIFSIFTERFAHKGQDLFCPEILTYDTFDLTNLWDWLIKNCNKDYDLPYWATIWPGGRAMARFILNSGIFTGKRVLDFAAGSGITSIALLKTGAQPTAIDLDPMAAFAAEQMANLNNLKYTYILDNILISEEKLSRLNNDFDYIICSDVFYEKNLADNVIKSFSTLDIPVYFSDPGRMHVPRDLLEKVAEYRIPVHPEIENVNWRNGVIYRLRNPGS